MKIKLKYGFVRVWVDAVTFPDGDSLSMATPLAVFLAHCEMLGLKVDEGFTIDDEKGDTE